MSDVLVPSQVQEPQPPATPPAALHPWPDLSPASPRGRSGLALLALALIGPPIWSFGDPALRTPVTALVLVAAVAALQRLLRGWAQGRLPDTPGLRVATTLFPAVALAAALAALPAVLGWLGPEIPTGVLVAALVAGALESRSPSTSLRDWVPLLAAGAVVPAVVLVPVIANSAVGLVTPSAPHGALSFVGDVAVEPVRADAGVVELTVRHVVGAGASGYPRAAFRGELVRPARVTDDGEASLLTYRLPVIDSCLEPFVVLAAPAPGGVDDLARSTLRITSWIGPAGAAPCA